MTVNFRMRLWKTAKGINFWIYTVFAELAAPTEIVTPRNSAPPPKKGSFSKGGVHENVMGCLWVLVLGRVGKFSDPGLLIRQIRYA